MKIKSTKKYTVIIPHKNSPALVSRCLCSIPERENIEIYVVDDNSNIENRKETTRLCSQKRNCHYIECFESKGAGHARNVGIDHAKGEWLIFSDADDFFDRTFWNSIDLIVDNSNSDIIYFKVKGVNSDTLESANRGANYNLYVDNFLAGKENSEERLRYYHMVPWGKVFRRSFIIRSGIRYDEVMASNDVMFNIKAGSEAEKISANNNIMYYVTVSGSSLTKQKSRDLLRTRFEVLIRHYKFVISKGKPQCSYNFFKFVYRYSKPFGLKETAWYIKRIWQERVNPFSIIYKIGRY